MVGGRIFSVVHSRVGKTPVIFTKNPADMFFSGLKLENPFYWIFFLEKLTTKTYMNVLSVHIFLNFLYLWCSGGKRHNFEVVQISKNQTGLNGSVFSDHPWSTRHSGIWLSYLPECRVEKICDTLQFLQSFSIFLADFLSQQPMLW